jgi:hypothetical protein
VDWSALIAAAIAAERESLLETICEGLAGAFARERRIAERELADEIRSLRLELAEAQATIHELRAAVGAKVIDLPARRVN